MERCSCKVLVTNIFFITLVFCTALNLRAHSFDDPNRWMAPEKMAHRKNPIEAAHESIQRGKDLYQKKCALCHGKEAKGGGPAAKGLRQKPSNLVAMSGMHEDGDVAWKIAEGRRSMPGFKEKLSEEQIWDLVNFIQSLKGSSDEKGNTEKKH